MTSLRNYLNYSLKTATWKCKYFVEKSQNEMTVFHTWKFLWIVKWKGTLPFLVFKITLCSQHNFFGCIFTESLSNFNATHAMWCYCMAIVHVPVACHVNWKRFIQATASAISSRFANRCRRNLSLSLAQIAVACYVYPTLYLKVKRTKLDAGASLTNSSTSFPQL